MLPSNLAMIRSISLRPWYQSCHGTGLCTDTNAARFLRRAARHRRKDSALRPPDSSGGPLSNCQGVKLRNQDVWGLVAFSAAQTLVLPDGSGGPLLFPKLG
jgi:hypothetical protein